MEQYFNLNWEHVEGSRVYRSGKLVYKGVNNKAAMAAYVKHTLRMHQDCQINIVFPEPISKEAYDRHVGNG